VPTRLLHLHTLLPQDCCVCARILNGAAFAYAPMSLLNLLVRSPIHKRLLHHSAHNLWDPCNFVGPCICVGPLHLCGTLAFLWDPRIFVGPLHHFCGTLAFLWALRPLWAPRRFVGPSHLCGTLAFLWDLRNFLWDPCIRMRPSHLLPPPLHIPSAPLLYICPSLQPRCCTPVHLFSLAVVNLSISSASLLYTCPVCSSYAWHAILPHTCCVLSCVCVCNKAHNVQT